MNMYGGSFSLRSNYKEIKYNDKDRILGYAVFTDRINVNSIDKEIGGANAVMQLIKIMNATIYTVEKTVKEGVISGENEDW